MWERCTSTCSFPINPAGPLSPAGLVLPMFVNLHYHCLYAMGFSRVFLQALKKKQDGKDKDKDGTGANHDADVRSSVACFSMECMNE